MSRGHFVGLNYHRVLLTDDIRMEAYHKALEQLVLPGSEVLDLGSGSGIMAMWAARLGAARVWAIEPAPIVNVAERVARANRLSDSIRFIQADARRVVLPKSVDLLVTECMGNFFVTDEMQPVLRDARRFLGPDSVVCPRTISLMVAPVWLPTWREVSFWQDPIGGLDFSEAAGFALNRTYVVRVEPEFLAGEAARLARFPLLEAPDTIAAEVELSLDVPRTLHGFAGWFVADLTDDVVLDTGPHAPPSHWGQLVLPVAPLSVQRGDRVRLDIMLAVEASTGSSFTWSGTVRRDKTIIGRFAHDTSARFETAAPG